MMMTPAAAALIRALLLCGVAGGAPRFPDTKPFSVARFNELPLFETLPDESAEDLVSIQAGGDVIRRHGLGAHVGVYLSHRHFELQPGERLVARLHSGSFVIEPSRNETDALPYVYRLAEGQDGAVELLPMEFLAKPDASYRSQHDAVVSNLAFLAEYADALRRHGLLSKFSLFLLHRDRVGNSTLETSAGPRALAVHAEAEDGIPEDMFVRPVVYTVPDVPGIRGFCSHNKCGHGSCGHNKK